MARRGEPAAGPDRPERRGRSRSRAPEARERLFRRPFRTERGRRPRTGGALLIAVAAFALVVVLTLLSVASCGGEPLLRIPVVDLLLACIPLELPQCSWLCLRSMPANRLRTLLVSALAVVWLLFYPNAPYLFTDFIHIVEKTWIRSDPTEWLGGPGHPLYDIVMSAAFALSATSWHLFCPCGWKAGSWNPCGGAASSGSSLFWRVCWPGSASISAGSPG